VEESYINGAEVVPDHGAPADGGPMTYALSQGNTESSRAKFAELFPAVWAIAEPWLREALAMNRQHLVTSQDLRLGIEAGDYGLFLMRNRGDMIAAAAVVSFGQRPSDGGPYLALMACGGSGLEDWISDLVSNLKRVGRAAGCDEVMVLGRPGWRRVLAPYGAEEVSTILSVPTAEG
jgi:hypothetical protein